MEQENAATIEPNADPQREQQDTAVEATGGPRQSTGANEKRPRKGSRRQTNRRLRAELAELRERLREKESLVEALTKRLEQAAEQLDRIRRTGGDRGLHLTGGLPIELVESQKTLLEKLEHAIEQWEDLQAAAALGRLEVQIAELRDLIAGSVGEASAPTSHVDQTTAATADTDGAAETNTWEAMKAQLLAGADDDSPTSSPPADAIEENSTTGTVAKEPTDQPASPENSSSESETSIAVPVPEVPPPEPIDLDQADAEQLREAVETRDAYICYLLKKLKVAPTTAPPADWDSLQNAPEELKQKLEELYDQLNEKLRLAEVDLSLERARLAREEAALRLREEQLEQRLKQLGLEQDGAGNHETDSKRKRRWLKFLSRPDDGAPDERRR